jgi:hypothetical protein
LKWALVLLLSLLLSLLLLLAAVMVTVPAWISGAAREPMMMLAPAPRDCRPPSGFQPCCGSPADCGQKCSWLCLRKVL